MNTGLRFNRCIFQFDFKFRALLKLKVDKRMRIRSYNLKKVTTAHAQFATLAAFCYSLLNIYSARYVCYRFWALAVNIGTHPLCWYDRFRNFRSGKFWRLILHFAKQSDTFFCQIFSCKNASNKPNFIKIGDGGCVLDNYRR